jgi:hypothetical protein
MSSIQDIHLMLSAETMAYWPASMSGEMQGNSGQCRKRDTPGPIRTFLIRRSS